MPWGCGCQTWLVHKIGLFITSSFEAWMRKFGKSSNWKSWVCKWQGGSQSLWHYEPRPAKLNVPQKLNSISWEKFTETFTETWMWEMWGARVCRETLWSLDTLHVRGTSMQRDFMWLSMMRLKLIHHPCRSHIPSSATDHK
jgi:hypothetical protein